MRLRYVGPLLALVLAVGLLADYVWKKPAAITRPLAEQLASAVSTLPVGTPSTSTFAVEFEGEVVADRILTLSAPVDGVLKRFTSAEEAKAAKGQELGALESDELTGKLLENESKVEELRATVQLYSPTSSPDLRKLQAALDSGRQKYRYAESSFSKVEELFRRGLISGREHADALVQLQADGVELAAAERAFADARSLSSATYLKVQNQLELALIEQARLRDSQAKLSVHAPFAGSLRRYTPPGNHHADAWAVGDTVKAGDPLFYLESENRVAKIEVSPQMLVHFSRGDEVVVAATDDGAQSFVGTVEDILRAPYEEGGSTLDEPVAQIRITIQDAKFQRAPPRKVLVRKDVPQLGFAIPAGAVVSDAAERFVYAKNCADVQAPFVRRRVTVNGEQAGTVLVTSGLLPSDCVAEGFGTEPWAR